MSDTATADPTPAPTTTGADPAPAAGAPPVETPAPPTEHAAAAAPPASPPPVAPDPTPDPAPAPKAKRTVQVPVWLLGIVAVLVLGVGAFFLGRATAPEAEGPETLAEAVEETARGELPVGDFDLRSLLQAVGQNEDLDLGRIGDLLLGGGGR